VLGLGSNITGISKVGTTIVTDNLVLRHDYKMRAVEPLSDGAADINADAANNEYIDVGLIPITTNDVSISAWVYITTWVNYAGIVVNRSNSGTNPGLELRCANGAQKFQLVIDDANGSSSAAISSTLNSNQWYHVCGVWDRSGNMSLYIDGVLDGTDDITGNPLTLTHSTATKIGQASTTEMRGYVCNVGYWDRVLSQAEVKSIMNKNYDSLSASEKTDLVSWWNLDSTVPGFTTTVYDNHGGETFGGEILTQPILTGTNWSNVNGTVSDGIGTVTIPADGTYSYFRHGNMTSTYITGGIYRAVVTVKGTAGKDIRVRSEIGSDNGGLTATTGRITLTGNLQTETFDFKSNGQDDDFRIERHDSDEAYSFEIHSVSLKKLNGNTGTLS